MAAIRRNGKTDATGLVPSSFWAFCPKEGSKHKDDYHKAFNASNYIELFSDQLLPNLHEPSLTISDNAAYQKRNPAQTHEREAIADIGLLISKVNLAYSTTKPIIPKQLTQAMNTGKLVHPVEQFVLTSVSRPQICEMCLVYSYISDNKIGGLNFSWCT